MITDYEKIKKIVIKNNGHIYKNRVRNYNLYGYVVIRKYEIIEHSHIDLEVATTHYIFDKEHNLIDVTTSGWY